jgi:hypothetical protein
LLFLLLCLRHDVEGLNNFYLLAFQCQSIIDLSG